MLEQQVGALQHKLGTEKAARQEAAAALSALTAELEAALAKGESMEPQLKAYRVGGGAGSGRGQGPGAGLGRCWAGERGVTARCLR